MRTPPAIEAYGGGGFRIEGVRHDGATLILDDAAQAWSGQSLADLTPDDFAVVIAAGPAAVEFVLLGAGPETLPPPRAVRDALRAAGIGLEVMDTPTAIRTYNVLAQEGRRVAAVLIPV